MHPSTSSPSSATRHRAAALGACLAAGLLVSCQSTPPAPPPVSPDTWAVVDGETITRDEVEKAFQRIGDSSQTLSEDEATTAKLGILEDLITEEILLAKARTLKLDVAATEIDTAYTQAKQSMTDAAFEQELTKRSLTADDMREGIRRQLLAQKVIDQEVGAKITVSEQEIADFFTANREQFNLPEDAYHLAQIVITPVRDAQIVNRTGDDATTPQAAAAKVQMVMERLKGGAAFADLARDYSEDPESTPRGGDLGLVPLSAIKQAAPALRDAVLNVKPGSARVASQEGAHTIVYVVAFEPAGQRDLSQPAVRERISATLRGRKEQLLRTAYLTAARTDADVVNHLARRVVQTHGAAAAPPPAGAQ